MKKTIEVELKEKYVMVLDGKEYPLSPFEYEEIEKPYYQNFTPARWAKAMLKQIDKEEYGPVSTIQIPISSREYIDSFQKALVKANKYSGCVEKIEDVYYLYHIRLTK